MFQRVLKAGLVYELVALHSPLPTITHLVWGCRRRSVAVYAASLVAVLSGLSVVAWHLIVEGLESIDD